jgi:23S rRNA (adenine2503-C2)-methyltransferase
LHAPNDEIRKKIMPVDHTYPLKDLMASLDEYVKETNKRIFYEYIMIN